MNTSWCSQTTVHFMSCILAIKTVEYAHRKSGALLTETLTFGFRMLDAYAKQSTANQTANETVLTM